MFRSLRTLDHRIAIMLLACTLLLRVLVPAGWMPTTGADGLTRLTLCSGMSVQTVWVDRDGKLHKETPAGDHHDPQPCSYAGLAQSLDGPPPLVLALSAAPAGPVALVARQISAIGHGLAAPPPPATGPPSLT